MQVISVPVDVVVTGWEHLLGQRHGDESAEAGGRKSTQGDDILARIRGFFGLED